MQSYFKVISCDLKTYMKHGFIFCLAKIYSYSAYSDEVLLRWLLLERSKYYSLFPYVERNAWYILPESEQIELGKQYFLNTVGIKIIRVPTYDAIYKAFSV